MGLCSLGAMLVALLPVTKRKQAFFVAVAFAAYAPTSSSPTENPKNKMPMVKPRVRLRVRTHTQCKYVLPSNPFLVYSENR